MSIPSSSEPKPKRSRLIRKFGLAAGAGFLLLLLVYFVVTSGLFFKSVILPKVARSMNVDLTVAEASIHPFSSVTLKELRLKTTGDEPLLTAREVRANYSLWAILRGTIAMEEVLLDSPSIRIEQRADGTSNLDPLLKAGHESPAAPPAQPKAPGSPTHLAIGKVELRNAHIHQVTLKPDGGREETEIKDFNLVINDLKTGQPSSLELSAQLALANHPAAPAPAPASELQAALGGKFSLVLGDDLMPQSLSGNSRLTVNRATGDLAELQGAEATFEGNLSPNEWKQCLWKFQKGTVNLGEISITGPFNLSTMEGDLAINVHGIDHQVLNLLAAGSGLQFQGATLLATNRVRLTAGGTQCFLTGDLRWNDAVVRQQNQSTPSLDASALYSVAVDTKASTATLENLTLSGLQNKQPMLSGVLTQPMRVSWAPATTALGDSRFVLLLTNVNLADWKPFLAETGITGRLGLQLDLISSQAGRDLALQLETTIAELKGDLSGQSIQNANLTLSAQSKITELRRIDLAQGKVILEHGGTTALSLSASGPYDLEKETGDIQIELDAQLPALLRAMPQPDLQLTNGTLSGNFRVSLHPEQSTLTGGLVFGNLTGPALGYRLQNYGVNLDLDATQKGSIIAIQKLNTTLTQGNRAGGTIAVSGSVNTESQQTDLRVSLTGLNETGLGPFVEGVLPGKTLVSLSLQGTNSIRYDPAAASMFVSEMRLANLVLKDARQAAPMPALEAAWRLESILAQHIVQLRDTHFDLQPTSRADNRLNLEGQIDLSATNWVQGSLQCTAQTLDLTPYYDSFGGAPAAPTSPVPGPPPPQPTAPPEQEPEAMTLPFRNFTLVARLGRVFLRELELTNVLLQTTLDGAKVQANPVGFALNGRPVALQALVDLGVPGYRYDLGLSMDRIPIQPIVNSFLPDYKDRMQGELLANVQIKGTGTTESNLQKNLETSAQFAFTNANIALVGPWTKAVLVPIATVLRLEGLTRAPLNWMDGRVGVSQGTIDLHHFQFASDYFWANVAGEIPMATVLTNSALSLPIQFALQKDLAFKSKLMPTNAPVQNGYVTLPNFASLRGTLGDPKTKIDSLVAAGLVAKASSGLGNLVDDKTGAVLQDIGSFLTGEKNASTNKTSGATNNPPAKINPLDLLNRLKK